MEPARRAAHHIDASGERPVVVGTDIKVSQIASEVEHLGMSADEVVEAHPALTLADVHGALAFFYDHPDIVKDEWEESRELIERLKKSYPSRVGSR